MKIYLYIYVLLLSIIMNAQKKDSLPRSLSEYILIEKGDTLTISLEGFSLFPKHKFKSQTDIRYYYWFRRKVFKAYPYAKLASERLDTLKNRLQKIKSKRKRKKYISQIQKYLEDEFTAPLKKMTRTEGRILVKLINRQTGKSVYQNIKEFKSGWKAFWYNTTANAFKLSLKEEYHPESNNEDFLIEDVLQRAFINDRLEHQIPKSYINFSKILQKNKGTVNVEKYKKMFSKRKYRKNRKKNKIN